MARDISIDRLLVEVAYKTVVTRNEYGDIVYGEPIATRCLYRDISTLNRSGNSETVALDGLLWLKATETVQRGDIYYVPLEGYIRVERVIRAKRLLKGATIYFIKCEVTKQRQLS